ncbi:outer membrane beta-barrel protein [Gelidibacter sp. F63206]|uniref:outer membrane beta-barrel protein n=1 Tax=Gelidibacter sp. F63206 TaxID=2926425 RepID=UPI001FF3C953|nr:outer membrane beta-barrel protein [Gelidibacter sp. F63206]MCK0114865.1 PorT family protein [Gelidibacter sp. F63206]
MKILKKFQEQFKSKHGMRRNLVLAGFAIAAFTFSTTAQNGDGFGIKAGLNYNGNGDYFESIEANAKSPDKNVGFHVGLYGKIGDRFYFKPELVYTQTKSEYSNDAFKMKKIDAPMLFGVKILGPVSVFAGPSLQYIIDSEFEGITINDIENDFTVGLNFGIGLNFNGFGIDLRYEKGLSENQATFGIPESRIDTRPEQLILGISFAL